MSEIRIFAFFVCVEFSIKSPTKSQADQRLKLSRGISSTESRVVAQEGFCCGCVGRDDSSKSGCGSSDRNASSIILSQVDTRGRDEKSKCGIIAKEIGGDLPLFILGDSLRSEFLAVPQLVRLEANANKGSRIPREQLAEAAQNASPRSTRTIVAQCQVPF